MSPLKSSVSVFLVAFYCTLVSGCGETKPPEIANSNSVTGHQDEHDTHSHEGHEHKTVIDAAQAGLDVDSLPHLEEAELPESLPNSVIVLTGMRDTIRDGFKAGDIEKADGPLHEVGHLLEHIEDLAKKSSLTDAEKKQISDVIESLFKDFGLVDERVHDKKGEKGKPYSEVADSIDAAIKTLSDLSDVKTE